MNKMSYYQKQRIKNIFRIALKSDYSEVECFKKHTLEFLYLKSLTTLNSNKWHKMKWKQEKKNTNMFENNITKRWSNNAAKINQFGNLKLITLSKAREWGSLTIGIKSIKSKKLLWKKKQNKLYADWKKILWYICSHGITKFWR